MGEGEQIAQELGPRLRLGGLAVRAFCPRRACGKGGSSSFPTVVHARRRRAPDVFASGTGFRS